MRRLLIALQQFLPVGCGDLAGLNVQQYLYLPALESGSAEIAGQHIGEQPVEVRETFLKFECRKGFHACLWTR